MTYEEYIALGSEDRMRARLNDLALAAARQEPVETLRVDEEQSGYEPKLLGKLVRFRKFKRATALAKARAYKSKRYETSYWVRSTKFAKIPGRLCLEEMSRQVGVDVATFERVIEAYEHLGTGKKN